MPLTNLQVLEMLISYGTNDQVGEKQHVHIEHNDSGEVRITGFIEGQVKIDDKGNPIISHSDWFDLNKSIGSDYYLWIISDLYGLSLEKEEYQDALRYAM